MVVIWLFAPNLVLAQTAREIVIMMMSALEVYYVIKEMDITLVLNLVVQVHIFLLMIIVMIPIS